MMNKHLVSIVDYQAPFDSVKKAVDLCHGLDHMPAGARVFIKPNIVFWTKAVAFPKWGVITTSRVVEDIVALLKDHGAGKIIIGEGTVTRQPKDVATPAHAFATLGYPVLAKRYGVEFVNVFERPFEAVDLGNGVKLNFNTDIIHSDFVVDLPVLKTHNQTVVSLGIKNLKGTIDIASRKKCHSADPQKDLHFWVSHLADKMPPMLTVIDGIFSAERGPGFDGRLHRRNLLIASADVLAADVVGASVLGYNPADVPHLALAGVRHGRPVDLSDIAVKGRAIADVAAFHAHHFEYSEYEKDAFLPAPLVKEGLRGISYRKYDLSMCTYCSGINGVVLSAIRYAWKGQPWDKVEVLTGKTMTPTPGMNKTILLGKCMVKANKDHPAIKQMIAVKGCPPDPKDIVKALHAAGIAVDPTLFDKIDELPGFFMARYAGKPEFDESFFTVPGNHWP